MVRVSKGKKTTLEETEAALLSFFVITVEFPFFEPPREMEISSKNLACFADTLHRNGFEFRQRVGRLQRRLEKSGVRKIEGGIKSHLFYRGIVL